MIERRFIQVDVCCNDYRIARRAWRIDGYRRWVGNWCWDCVFVKAKEKSP